MDERKQELLQLIVEEYIATAEPVGSQFLVQKMNLPVSGATVRNEMRELEEEGFLTHPHTSAGRLPTEAGYTYYVDHLMKPAPARKKVVEDIQSIIKETQKELRLKELAKYVADAVGSAVIVAWKQDAFYYTGISNLFSQPEFQDYQHTVQMSQIFDHCEDRLNDLFLATNPEEVSVLIGKKNPLGSACTTIATQPEEQQLFAILGPMRMRYRDTIGLLRTVRDYI
ncbi:MAG TPA: hypothetical protein VEA18_03590 [Candidatus Kapabacteria bacterium]|nr:hypothetical protein [Candidatus Kapabacteria bacterium]